jgi:hypothetical protein
MGMEPQAEKTEAPPSESATEDKGKRFRGNQRRFTKKKTVSKDVTISKTKFKGSLDALIDYYFDTGPTQAHDFKKTHKKISTYTGTKYSAEVMMSIENMEYYNWASSMPRKPIKSDFDTSTGGISNIATVIPQEYLDRYEYKIKSHCKREDKYEVDMKLSFTVIHGQCTDDMLHELKCQQKYESIRNNFDPIELLKLIQQISYNYQAQDFALMAIAKAQEAIYVEKQSQNESNIDYLLTFKNRAVVLEAVGGNLANDGVKKYMAEKLYSQKYDVCTDIQKKECTTKG